MKKLLFILLMFITSFIYSQGSTTTPYDTQGWDIPIEYSQYYDFAIYRLLSNPGGWINLNTKKADSLFNALIVYTDPSQLVIANDSLKFNPDWISNALGSAGDGLLSVRMIPTDKVTVGYQEGLFFYDSTAKALVGYIDEPDVTQQLGQELLVRVYNATVSTILNGSPVYLLGTFGNVPAIDIADADVESTSSVVGLATHDIEAGTFGYVTKLGFVNELNTNAYSPGDILYLSTTAGQFTNVAPSAPDQVVKIGTVVNNDLTDGNVLVNIDLPDEADAIGAFYWEGSANIVPLDASVEKKITSYSGATPTGALFTTDANVTHEVSEVDDGLVLGHTGVYILDIGLSFQGGSSGQYKAYVKKNTTTLPYSARRSTTSTDTGNFGFHVVVNATAGDVLTLWIINTGSATDFTSVSGNIIVEQVR